MSDIKLKCDIINNRFVWLRTNQLMGTIQLFLFLKLTGHWRRIRVAIGKITFFELTINPFENQISLEVGRRFFDYGPYDLHYRVSKSLKLK